MPYKAVFIINNKTHPSCLYYPYMGATVEDAFIVRHHIGGTLKIKGTKDTFPTDSFAYWKEDLDPITVEAEVLLEELAIIERDIMDDHIRQQIEEADIEE